MKLVDIAKHIDKSENNKCWVNTEVIGENLNIQVPCLEQTRLTSYWVGNWCCTDSYVGYKLYFLDEEPVAFTSQEGRKSNESFHWFSLEAAKKVKTHLLSLVAEEDFLSIQLCDIEEDIGIGFQISFNAEIINTNRVSYKGEKVTMIERIKNRPHGIDTRQKIQLGNGEIKEVDVKELTFGYHLVDSI